MELAAGTSAAPCRVLGQCQAARVFLNPRTPLQTELTSILHICIPGVVMLRELLTWEVRLVMVTSLEEKACEGGGCGARLEAQRKKGNWLPMGS